MLPSIITWWEMSTYDIIFTVKIKIAWTYDKNNNNNNNTVHTKWRKVAAAIKSFVTISVLICPPHPSPFFFSFISFFCSLFSLSIILCTCTMVVVFFVCLFDIFFLFLFGRQPLTSTLDIYRFLFFAFRDLAFG